MKQTAVEWLLEKIKNKNGKEFASYYVEFINPAKEIEKRDIMNAWANGVTSEDYMTAQQYYNETFNKD